MKRTYMISTSLLFSLVLFCCTGCAPSLVSATDLNEAASFAASTLTESPVLTPTPTATPSPTPTPTPSPTPTPGPPEGYSLVFSDEFEGEAIDESIWGFEIGPWPYNKELESYTRENAYLENGLLVIEARKESQQGRDYTSARLTTLDKQDFTYGYVQVRAALPTGVGTWSAIWLLPSDLRYGGYLRSGEIDMMERVGYDDSRIHATIHTYKNNTTRDNAITNFAKLPEGDDSFHIYSMLWQEDRITIYLDGIETLSYEKGDRHSPNVWPFDVPFHLILNLAVGGNWGGIEGIDEEAFPQRMLVDYVRYYSNSTFTPPESE